jgi:hypothetical protein
MFRELEQSVVLREFLRSRAPKDGDSPGCVPNCKWILDDLERNGKLTGYPLDSVGLPIYPIDSKLLHLHLELIGPCPEEFWEDREHLVGVVLRRVKTLVLGN